MVCTYLRYRYGGDVLELKPPIGPGLQPGLYRLAVYWLWQRPRWEVEKQLFQRWGGPMRQAWREAFPDYDRAGCD